MIESRPPLNLAKRGLQGGDAEIDAVCELIENMGRLGHPHLVLRVDDRLQLAAHQPPVESRGGSFVSGYEHDLMRRRPESDLGPISEEELWETLEYFLRRVVPVAEEAGVQLAMHPDDPPVSPIRGVGRIMRSVDNYQRLLDLVPVPMNGITLCQGNFALMTRDLPAAIRAVRQQQKIFFVHLRDVRGTVDRNSSRPGTTTVRPTCWPACGPTTRSASTACCGPTTCRRSRATTTATPAIRATAGCTRSVTSAVCSRRYRAKE